MSKQRRLTPRQIKRLSRYVGELQFQMHLGDKIIEVEHRLTRAKRVLAEIEGHEEQPRIYLRVSRRFLTLTAEEQRLVITHELVHALFHNFEAIMRLVGDLRKPCRHGDLANDVYHREMEMLVERLAFLIAPTLPLPHKRIR